MTKPRQRLKIGEHPLPAVSHLNPTSGVQRIGGVRIHDIGQGDSISILDEHLQPFMQIDYGGRMDNPFVGAIDEHVPVRADSLLMLSHWDEDHWCSAPKGTSAKAATWLVPRQITSPRAVMFSTTLSRIFCVPEEMVREANYFATAGGDRIYWEKIASAPPESANDEDCNHTGIAFSIVRHNAGGADNEVILLPGDAPFGAVGHYASHRDQGFKLRGMVAYHHGANRHLRQNTRKLLGGWSRTSDPVEIVFSCAEKNSFGHPHRGFYLNLPYPSKALVTTPELRAAGYAYYQILF